MSSEVIVVIAAIVVILVGAAFYLRGAPRRRWVDCRAGSWAGSHAVHSDGSASCDGSSADGGSCGGGGGGGD